MRFSLRTGLSAQALPTARVLTPNQDGGRSSLDLELLWTSTIYCHMYKRNWRLLRKRRTYIARLLQPSTSDMLQGFQF